MATRRADRLEAVVSRIASAASASPCNPTCSLAAPLSTDRAGSPAGTRAATPLTAIRSRRPRS